MSFTEYQDALRGDFDAQMAANSAATLIQYENLEKLKVGGSNALQDPPVLNKATPPWCRFAIRTADNADRTRALRQDLGIVAVQVFGPPNRGSGSTEDLAETIAAGLRRRTVTIAGRDQIQYRSVTTREVGIEPEGWYQINVQAAFSRFDKE